MDGRRSVLSLWNAPLLQYYIHLGNVGLQIETR
jgi:hypothetical protein